MSIKPGSDLGHELDVYIKDLEVTLLQKRAYLRLIREQTGGGSKFEHGILDVISGLTDALHGIDKWHQERRKG